MSGWGHLPWAYRDAAVPRTTAQTPERQKSKVALLRLWHNICIGYKTVVWLWFFGFVFYKKHFLVKETPPLKQGKETCEELLALNPAAFTRNI